MSFSSSLTPLLHAIQVPEDFARYENIAEDPALSRLDDWKQTTERVIEELRWNLDRNAAELSLEDEANVISAVVVLDGEGPWITAKGRKASRDILAHYSDPPTTLLMYILKYKLKPVFQSNPNPLLKESTGRKLARPAGGPMASQDFYDGQTWKSSPGIYYLVSWCVRHVQREAYETLWHLIIPPVMAFLDDYEARYKLQGAEIVSELLQHVPKDVLRKTGVDSLIRSSLSICLTHLQSPETARLIEAAISASLSLTLLTTEIGSSERFDQLCALLGEGIISGIWLYASDKPEVILASLNAMPPLIKALGIGNARYLKALITQLVHPLKTVPLNPWPIELQISSIRLLSILIEDCPPCLPRWKATILTAVGISWVVLRDSGSSRATSEGLEMELRHICASLASCCPSVIQEEYPKLLAANAKLFGDLLDRPL